jgi:hypothetical protein
MFVRELGQLYGPSTGPPPNFIEIDGDEQFGYGYLTDNPDVFIIWVTDRNGTHYYTVDKNSEALRGTIDPLTNERDNNGFISYIDERNKLSNEIEQLENQYQNERRSEFGLVIGSAVSVSGGILLCGIGIAIAAGTGALLAPVSITLCAAGGTAIIGGSVLFFSKAIPAMSDTVETRDNIQDLRDDINENDEDMLHLFQTTYSFP